MRLPDRRRQMLHVDPPRYLSSVPLFCCCQTLHLTDSLQSFFFEIYSVLGAFTFHLAELRTGPRWFRADFWGDRLLKSLAEATPCHLQSLSLTVPREAPPSLLNCHHSQELSDASGSLPALQSGACSPLVHLAAIHSPKAKRPSSTSRRQSRPRVMGGDGSSIPLSFPSHHLSLYLEHTQRALPCSWRGKNYRVPICHSQMVQARHHPCLSFRVM